MQFCTECGGALNLFESNDEKVCWPCIRKKEKQKPPPSLCPEPFETDDLSEATIEYENNMIILRAKEGWILWSGPDSQKVSIGTIMTRARHIHAIRKKRQQSKS
jgi:hypothetical protein